MVHSPANSRLPVAPRAYSYHWSYPGPWRSRLAVCRPARPVGRSGGKASDRVTATDCPDFQVVVFFALVAGGQLLSIGWRDRELQIATGLGFFSFVSIAMAFLQMHETSWAEYRQLISIEIGASICCLLYWIVSFAQREAKRREFTPEMQRILLARWRRARNPRCAHRAANGQAGQPRSAINALALASGS